MTWDDNVGRLLWTPAVWKSLMYTWTGKTMIVGDLGLYFWFSSDEHLVEHLILNLGPAYGQGEALLFDLPCLPTPLLNLLI